jgi:hypothetical protein
MEARVPFIFQLPATTGVRMKISLSFCEAAMVAKKV